jgi:hypothetical protein
MGTGIDWTRFQAAAGDPTVADWWAVGLAGAALFIAVVTLAIGIAAFLYAKKQLDASSAQARKARLDNLVQRMTSRETARAQIDGAEVLRIVSGEGPSERRRLWDALRASTTEDRLKRAQVIYVLNLLEELGKDCASGAVDPKEAKLEFKDAVSGLWDKWGWLVEDYQHEDELAGVPKEERRWYRLSCKAELWL